MTQAQTVALFQQCLSYYQQGDYDAAIAGHKQLIEVLPLWDEPYYHIAVCLQIQRHYTQAYAYYLAAISLKPKFYTLYHAAKCLKDSQQVNAALALYQQAIQQDPNMADVQYSLGLCYFLKREWLKAWPLYEKRFVGSDRAGTDQATPLNLPKLNPSAVTEGTKLVITAEQGMGDAIMCLRYLPYLKQHVEKICWVTHYPLLTLFEQYQDEQVTFIPWLDPLPTIEGFTHQFPMLSLPGAFNTTPDNLPNTSYIQAQPEKRNHWQGKLNALSPQKKRIGLVWQGGKVSVANGRDVPFSSLESLLNDSQLNQQVDWYSLQKDSTPPTNSNIIHLMDAVQDFTDTAAFIANLDLIITVDTSVAHLAGAMGKPVWLLNRFESEWRWGLHQQTSPWYPSMRLFNQTAVDDWQSTVARVAQALSTNFNH